MLSLKRIVSLSVCMTILFVVQFTYTREIQTVLKPNQLMTFSLAPGQEKAFVLQMKKGDFAGIESLSSEGLGLSFEIYDSARKELLEKSDLFVAPRDGNFIVVCKLEKFEGVEITGTHRVSMQYNNKFKLPSGTKLQAFRKVKDYDVKIMMEPESLEVSDTGYPVFLFEKNGQVQKIMKGGEGESDGFDFDHGCCQAYQDFGDNLVIYSKDDIYIYSDGSDKTQRGIQLIKSTPALIRRKMKFTEHAKVYFSDELPDIVIEYFSGGRYCCNYTYFFNLDDTVKMTQPGIKEIFPYGKNPTGGLLFEAAETSFANWLKADCLPSFACARSSHTQVILEFSNGAFRPNWELMKKPPPSLAVLRRKAQKFRHQLSHKPYRGDDKEYPGLLYSGIIYADIEDENDKEPGVQIIENREPEDPFWDEMIDLIYTGNEELAWQFLDLIWPPQKKGKALFIRDFKNQLLKSPYWQMKLEDSKK